MRVSVVTDIDRSVITVHVAGEVDIATCTALREALAGAVRRTPKRLVVDLADVSFLDCSGVHALVEAWRRARPAGTEVTVANPRPIVRKLLGVTQVDRLLTVVDTPQPAP